MHMRRRSLSRVDKRINAVDNGLCASESQHGEALVAELARLKIVNWLSLRQSLRQACEDESCKQHRNVCLG
jgi:hypothetical protein